MNELGLAWSLAIRYLRPRGGARHGGQVGGGQGRHGGQGAWLSLITYLCGGGVVLGVGALVITLSVMNGFQTDLRDKILGAQAHVLLQHQLGMPLPDDAGILGRIRSVPGVIAVSPFVTGQSVLRVGRQAMGAVIKGVDPAGESQVAKLDRAMPRDWVARLTAGEVILGAELARNLGARAGDDVVAVSPFALASPVGLVPRMFKFRVGGVFTSGLYEYDSTLAYANLETARRLFDLPGRISGIAVRGTDAFHSALMAERVQLALGTPYWARDWTQTNHNLFSALALEKVVMTLLLILIVLVAAFGIASTLAVTVVEKTREVGILRAMGATRRFVAEVFLAQGLALGLAGAAGGTGLGVGLSAALARWQFVKLPADVYYISYLPVRIVPREVLLVGLAAVLICLAASALPAWRASRLDPCEALRYG